MTRSTLTRYLLCLFGILGFLTCHTPAQAQFTIIRTDSLLLNNPAKPELTALEKQLKHHKRRSTLTTLVGAGGVLGGIATVVVLNGAYGAYRYQIKTTNDSFADWYQQNYTNAPSAGDLLQPKSLFVFGAPSIYAAVAGMVGGTALILLGRRHAQLARQAGRNLEQKRTALSVIPVLNVPAKTAGVQLSLRF